MREINVEEHLWLPVSSETFKDIMTRNMGALEVLLDDLDAGIDCVWGSTITGNPLIRYRYKPHAVPVGDADDIQYFIWAGYKS